MLANKTKINKRIELLIKILFLIITYSYLYFEIFYKDKASILLSGFKEKTFSLSLLCLVLLLMPINWGIEAIKWRYSVSKIQKISVLKSLKAIFTSTSLGLLTPNRIGEIPGRAVFLDKCKVWEANFASSISAISQFIITILIGLIFSLFYVNYFTNNIYLQIILLVCIIFIILLIVLFYFKISILSKISYWKIFRFFSRFNKQIEIFNSFSSKMLLKILFYSFIRYLVFAFQLFVVFNAFSIYLPISDIIVFIPLYFLFSTLIPSVFISEIGVRGASAVYVLKIMDINNVNLNFDMLIATTSLWFINIILPAIIGSFFIPSIKLKTA